MLATFNDANRHLDGDKLKFPTAHDAEPEATSVGNEIRGALYGVYGEQVELWDAEPTGSLVAAPQLVREIAGMLMAANRYEKMYALEDDVTSTHGSRLRRRAEAMILQLRVGDLVLVEADIVSGVAWSESDFWPNSTSVIEGTVQPARRFWMDMEF